MLKCSVILPNYNHYKYLEQRITSILHQTLQDFELIILDDYSSDESVSIIEKLRHHPKVSQIFINKENSNSPFLQWIKGIEKASGDWIWIAESDDYADPLFLETAFKELAKCPNAGLFYCDSKYDTQYGTPYRFENSSDFKNNYFKSNKWSNSYCISGTDELNNYLKYICTIINSSSALFKREHLINCINNLKNFRYHGDWFCMIYSALQADICYSSKKLSTCRMHKDNFLNSINKTRSKEEYFRILTYLNTSDKVTEKSKLIRFFTQQFIGFGIINDGIINGFMLLKKYYRINRLLCWKVVKELIFQKVMLRRRKTIY